MAYEAEDRPEIGDAKAVEARAAKAVMVERVNCILSVVLDGCSS